MSVVVRMEMPESCYDCPMEYDGFACSVTGTHFWRDADGNVIDKGIDPSRQRQNNCPIICQLPEGHGRLVDVNEFEAIMFEDEATTYKSGWNNGLRAAMQYLTTIVPADTAERR